MSATPPSVTAGRRRRESRKRRPALALETLGDRTLMAASLTASLNAADGVLRIEGTYGADQIHVRHSLGAVRIDGVAISVTDGEATTTRTSVPRGQVTRIEVAALDGNDVVQMHDTLQLGEAAVPMVIHGGAGSDTLIGGKGADKIFGDSGADSIQGGTGNDSLYGDSDPAAAQLAGAYHLKVDTAANNYLGKNDKWVTSRYDYAGGIDEYYITPEGEFHYYATYVAGTYTVNDRLVATLDPSYYQDLRKFETERDLYDYNLYYGWGNRDEKWLVGDGDPQSDGWFFITPVGEVGRWDGTYEKLESGIPVGGTIVATLGFAYHADPRELVAAATDDAANDVLDGQGGNDLLDGGAGNDFLTGGWGNDVLSGGFGNDNLRGEDGNDNLLAGEGNDRVYAGLGNDWAYGEGGDDTLYGEAGADDVKAGDGRDTVYGGDGDDWLYGDNDADLVIGDRGNDNVRGGADDDSLLGGFGNDWLYGGGGNDTLEGEVGADNLRGEDGNDILLGWSGDDWLYGGDGADYLVGQNGSDFLTGENGDDVLDGGWAGTTPEYGAANDTLYGGDGNDRMWGGEGNDALTGDSGADTLMGETGADDLDGGLRGFAPEVGAANDLVDGGDGSDRMWGGEGDDTLTGGRGQDTLHGEAGHDRLDAGLLGFESEGTFAANDLLFGGDGNDSMWGGEGHDTLVGESGADLLMGEIGADVLDGGLLGFAPEVGAANDLLDGGPGNDRMWGGEGDDTLTGGRGQDTLNGEAGRDLLDGGLPGFESEGTFGSNDLLDGGEGDDLAWGGEGSDTLVGGFGNDSLNGELGADLLDGGLLGFASEGAGADRLDGGEGNDTVFGGEGDDTLRGAEGNDRLVGESGNDVLYGGAGADRLEGGFGQDGLFGGTLDPRDDLFGGPDADRILSADDNDRDRAPEDALLHFVSDGAAVFTDAEIEALDKGFAWLHAVRGNPALLVLQDGGVITFERVGQLDSPTAMADNDSDGKIRIANWCFQAAIPADATIVHEIGHNWDEEMGDFFEDQWLPLSGWETDGIGASEKEESLDGDWLYNFDAPFARDYGKTNPREDWCTAWEAYYVDRNYPGALFGAPPPTVRNNYNYTGMAAKFAVLDRFFAGNF